MSDAAPGPLIGLFERADREAIVGWAADASAPEATVELELLIDGESVGPLPARLFRADVKAAGIGDGCHGFHLHLPDGLSVGAEHVVSLRRRGDAMELSGSPRIIPREDGDAPDGRAAIEEALELAASTASADQLDALLAQLARRAAELLFRRGEALPDPQAALIERWSGGRVASIGNAAPRALFIDEGAPSPGRDAGSNAVMSHMRALQRLGFRVDFVASYGLDPIVARSDALEAMGITCWHAPWIGSVEEVLRRLGDGLDVVYLHRFATMQRYGSLVRRWCPKARLLYCLADLHHLRMARQIAVESGGAVEDAAITGAVAGLRTAELLAILGADAAITHSSFEAERLRREVPNAKVHLIPWVVEANPTAVPFAARNGVAFVGSYGHAPNPDAAMTLLERIMPLVWQSDPGIACLLAGSEMPAALREAAGRAAGPVQVLGYVQTLDEVWNRVRLTAAPLRFGAGLKGKVLDSLAGGIPCVCSPMAAEGMDLPAELSELVAATSEAAAATILRLHGDAEANARLAAAGLDWVHRTLSATRIDAVLRAASSEATVC